MQIGGKDMENLLVMKKKPFKKAQIQKDSFQCLFTWECAK
jgi:hypothetical protein